MFQDPNKQFRRFQKGDRNAMQYFRSLYSHLLYSFLKRFARDEVMTRRLLSATFLELEENHSEIQDEQHLVNFLYQAACRLLREHGKMGSIKACIEEGEAEASKGASLVKKNLEITEATLELLTPRKRQVLTMRYVQGMHVKEIACELKIAPQTVLNHISQARKVIRKHLGGDHLLTTLDLT